MRNLNRFLHVFFSHVYSPRQGQTTYLGQKAYDNRKAFSLCPIVASFKMISSKSDFIHIFNRTTEILKSKSVRSTDDVIDIIRTCVQQSNIVSKTNDSSKNISEIDYFSNSLQSLNWLEAYMGGKRIKRVCRSLTLNF